MCMHGATRAGPPGRQPNSNAFQTQCHIRRTMWAAVTKTCTEEAAGDTLRVGGRGGACVHPCAHPPRLAPALLDVHMSACTCAPAHAAPATCPCLCCARRGGTAVSASYARAGRLCELKPRAEGKEGEPVKLVSPQASECCGSFVCVSVLWPHLPCPCTHLHEPANSCMPCTCGQGMRLRACAARRAWHAGAHVSNSLRRPAMMESIYARITRALADMGHDRQYRSLTPCRIRVYMCRPGVQPLVCTCA